MTMSQYAISFLCKEYIDGQFLAAGCDSRQRQVADGADVVFTNTRFNYISARCARSCPAPSV